MQSDVISLISVVQLNNRTLQISDFVLSMSALVDFALTAFNSIQLSSIFPFSLEQHIYCLEQFVNR